MTSAPDQRGGALEAAGEPEATIPLTEAEARALTDELRAGIGRARDAFEHLADRVTEALERKAWQALGYPSWPAYVSAELGGDLVLGRDDRRVVVVQLATLGMSTRAIAPVVGASKDTVARDLRAGVSDETPAPGPVTGLDGKAYPRPGGREPRQRRIGPARHVGPSEHDDWDLAGYGLVLAATGLHALRRRYDGRAEAPPRGDVDALAAVAGDAVGHLRWLQDKAEGGEP